jgi:hypothetical protein|tara:strand:- start:2722 stop:4671 length:1950 start_codon:yes stop_codon:yes gene_type:complete
MKIRIVVGKALVEQYQNRKGLECLHNASDCLVQGDSDVKLIKDDGPNRAFFVGRLIGKRSGRDVLDKMDITHGAAQELLCSQSIESCTTVLEGRFLLIKLDGETCEVACDRFGQIDMYYQQIDEGAVFASDLDMLPFKNETIKYDQVAVAHSLYVYGFRPAKRHTLYEGVRRLGVGEIACWQNNQLSFRELPLEILTTEDYGKDHHVKYKDLFLDVLEKQSSPNGNIVYLSSGWDSTAILAGLVELHGPNKVRAVIGRMHFSEQKGVCNSFEIKRAQQIADYFGVNLEIIEFDYFQRGPELTERFRRLMKAQMATSMACYQWFDLADYVATNYDGESVFCGEISDGVHNFGFSQMLTVLDHPVHEFREYSDKMASYLYGPTFLKTIWDGSFNNDCVYNFLRGRLGERFFDEPASGPVSCTRQLLASLFIRDNRFPLWSLKNNNFLTEQGQALYSKEMEATYINEAAEMITADPETLYSWCIHLYNSFHWNGGTVATLQMTEDEFGIKINLPFRDSRVQEFLAAMPESWGRGLEMRPTKYPLKWMLENDIDYPLHLQTGPHSYLYDVDPDFNHAAEWNYRSAFTPQYKTIMEKRGYRELLSPDFFDIEYFDKAVTNYLEGKEVLSERTDMEHLIYLSVMGWYGIDNGIGE